MSSASSQGGIHERTCAQFQLDLSCLVDGELAERSVGRAIAHLEVCPGCNEFLDDVRRQVNAHKQLADSEGLIERYSALVGASPEQELETIELVHRLSTIFYQLGKAYVLLAIDPDFRTRVFEKAVPVEPTRTFGRGFVDGVLDSGRGGAAGLDWRGARHMLNGRLSKIVDPKEKGRRLLREALTVDPTHEEARFYLAYLDEHEGKRVRAADAYRKLFESAVEPANRAHAAIHLGNLYALEHEFKKAIACCRWVVMSGVADEDGRFYTARYNVALYYADLMRPERSVVAFRAALDRHPERLREIAKLFQHATRTHAIIEMQPGFAEELLDACPELFETGVSSDSQTESEEVSE